MKTCIPSFFLLLAFVQLTAQNVSLEKAFNHESSTMEDNLRVNKPGSWHKVYPSSFVMPDVYHGGQFFHQILDYDQVVFQSCRSLNDNIWNQKRLTHYLNRWGTDTLGCSPEQINSFINGVLAWDEDSVLHYAIDENNNMDFTDDSFYAVTDIINREHSVIFERFINGKVVEDEVSITIAAPDYADEECIGFTFHIHEYRMGNIQLMGKSASITLNPDSWYSYHKQPEIIVSTPGINPQILTKYQFFRIGNTFYQVTEIHKTGTSMTVEKFSGKGRPISNQIGYTPPPIFDDGMNVLDEYKGKYTFIYFWNMDCAPCLQNLPDLKSNIEDVFYKHGKQVQILLISVDKPEESREFLKKHGIDMQNIETFGNSQIFDDFGIGFYPTSFLLDPGGYLMNTPAPYLNFDKLLRND